MDRREALKLLSALPATTRLTHAEVKPDDVIVVESTQILSDAAKRFIEDSLSHVWPGRRIVVLDHGLTLKIVEGVSR
jgi:hypothetical protein